MVRVCFNDKEFELEEAKTSEEKSKGLSNRESLDDNSGMIFYFDEPQTVSFWMKDTLIPLDIIFIDDNDEVISVKQGSPKDETPMVEDNVRYVVELNINSGVKKGDDFDFCEENKYVMKVLAPDGSTQMNLEGGERIVSRKETKILIKKAKRANTTKDDKDYKALGKYMFKVLTGQDNRDPEYVEAPSN